MIDDGMKTSLKGVRINIFMVISILNWMTHKPLT